jgi:hypothetical protein
MPKISMIFNLPEDKDEYAAAYNGQKYLTVLDELDNFLRSKIKYQDLSEEQYEIYSSIRSKLWELRNDE